MTIGALLGSLHCGIPAFESDGTTGVHQQPHEASYYPPPESEGGWRSLVVRDETPSPSEQEQILAQTGLDWQRLHEAWQAIEQHQGALLVIRNGWIAGEWGSPDSFHIASCTKSLTGLAMAKLFDLSDAGQLSQTIGPDDLAYTYLPAAWGNDEPARRDIRIRHLMTMSSGLEPHDQPAPQPGYFDIALSRTVEAPPEMLWAYASAPVDLLSLVVEDVAGTTLKDFFEQEIGGPIGIPPIPWQSADAHTMGSAYSELSARELARVAYLTLYGGAWDGAQVVSEARVSTVTQWAPFLASTTFRQPNNFATDTESHLRYGYLWWTNRTQTSFLGPNVPADAFYMAGYATNVAFAIPSLDLIIVRLGTEPTPWSDQLVQDLLAGVLAAVVADIPDGGAGGTTGTGGAGGTGGTGGTAGAGGPPAGPGAAPDDESGCGCRLEARTSAPPRWTLLLWFGAGLLLARRRRPASASCAAG